MDPEKEKEAKELAIRAKNGEAMKRAAVKAAQERDHAEALKARREMDRRAKEAKEAERQKARTTEMQMSDVLEAFYQDALKQPDWESYFLFHLQRLAGETGRFGTLSVDDVMTTYRHINRTEHGK